jgi:hypothetical protein
MMINSEVIKAKLFAAAATPGILSIASSLDLVVD